jgi:hypothetical protein
MFRSVTLAALVRAAACSSQAVKLRPDAVAGKVPDGRVEMREEQVAYIGSGSGSGGGGMLYYKGRRYPYTIGGIGIGGIGASSIDAEGEIYNLPDVSMFPGTYGQARYGFALGTESGGDLWMQNEQGVIMHLKARRTGLMLSLGGDAMIISMSSKPSSLVHGVSVRASRHGVQLPGTSGRASCVGRHSGMRRAMGFTSRWSEAAILRCRKQSSYDLCSMLAVASASRPTETLTAAT